MGLINKSQIKAFFRRNGARVGTLVYEKLEGQFERMLLTTIERAKKNVRTTIMEADV